MIFNLLFETNDGLKLTAQALKQKNDRVELHVDYKSKEDDFAFTGVFEREKLFNLVTKLQPMLQAAFITHLATQTHPEDFDDEAEFPDTSTVP